MKYMLSAGLVSTLVWLTGCTTTPNRLVLAPIGPPPGQQAKQAPEGYLRVYSARERAVISPEAEEFFWNNDFGRNEFLHQTAHTDYAIYSEDGKLVQKVRNAQGMNDEQPALVRLAPGNYQVQVAAEDYDAVTIETTVPVIVKAGQTTEAHLDRPWQPATHFQQSDVVWLPNGRIAGWRAN